MTTGLITQGSSPYADFYMRKSWSGSDGKIDAGHVKWNAYTMSAQTTFKRKSDGYNFYIAGTDEDAHLISWAGNDDIALYSKLATAVRGHSFNLGVAAAELPQSLSMIALNITRISKAVTAIKHGRIDHAVRTLGAAPIKSHNGKSFSQRALRSTDISSMWLEVQYGWRPLIQDVYEGMKAYSAVMDAPRRSVTIVTHRRKATETRLTPGSLILQDKSTEVSGRLIYEMSEALSVPRTLGLQNPAAVLWEKMPWSFVADWFIPVGTYLDAVSVVPNLSGRFLKTIKVSTETSGVGTTVGYKNATIKCRAINLDRTVPVSLSVPLPQFVPLNDVLSPGRIKNALALLHQAVFK